MDADRARAADVLSATAPEIVRLATLLSPAVRVEPWLLRRVRAWLAPDLPPAAESELWFSALIASRSTTAFVFDDGVVAQLRHCFAAQPEDVQLIAHDIVTWAHEHAPPTIRLEEAVIWHAMRGSDEDELNKLLAPALATMLKDARRESGIARWAERALPALPATAQQSHAGRMLRRAAQHRVGRVDPSQPHLSPRELILVTAGIARTWAGVRLRGPDIELSEPPDNRALAIAVPATEPITLRARAEGFDERVIEVSRGSTQRHRLGSLLSRPRAVEVVTADGHAYRVDPRPVTPLRRYSPSSIGEIVEIVRLAEEEGVTVRAVGAGVSKSDVALTDGFLVRTDRLARAPAPEPDFLRPEWQSRNLVRVEAGIRMQQLNAYLDRNGMGLSQTVRHDQITLAGAVSTSSHGSGMNHGPLNDIVRSLDMVVSGGRVVRVEQTDGPTLASAYGAHHGAERALIQDDHVFNAAVVAMGCMGIICTVLIEAKPKHYLREVREIQPWEMVRDNLADGDVLDRNEHYELYCSPYRGMHERACLVTSRNRIEPPVDRARHRGRRSWFRRLQLVSTLAPQTPNLLRKGRHAYPLLIETAMRAAAKTQSDNISHTFVSMPGTDSRAYGADIAIPMDGRHIEAIERIFAIADQQRQLDGGYYCPPIALRFVKASPAYLSMMYGQDTMMMEFIQVRRNRRGVGILRVYEEALYALGGRPHWAQADPVPDGYHEHRLVSFMYPRLADWQDVQRELNATGVFDSPFSERVGIVERPGTSDESTQRRSG